jgi:disulfide bond formation protein DsbB
MSEPTLAKFFAILSLLVWAGTILTIILAWLRRMNPDSAAGLLFDDIARNAVWFAFIVALGTTLGSLYLSEIAHFVPCPLCWYQRICMYPLFLALLVGGLRRDRMVWTYVLPPALIGAAFAIYHTQLQAFPNQHSSFCKTTEPCTVRYVWEFGFVSIPFMSLSAFAFIITMMLITRNRQRSLQFEDETDPDDETPSLVRGAV